MVVDAADLVAQFDDGPISVLVLSHKVGMADDPAGVWDLLASRPDLVTFLPTPYPNANYWVRLGSRRDPRRIVRALAKAPDGLTLKQLAGRVQITVANISPALDYLGSAVQSLEGPREGTATGGSGAAVWVLSAPPDTALARLDQAPPNPYLVPAPGTGSTTARRLSPGEVRQRMIEQIPGYRQRLRDLEAVGFRRSANQERLAEARREMAALEKRFTADRFRAVGSLVRGLEREREREQTPAPTQKPSPTPQVPPGSRRVGSGRPVPREATPFRSTWR